MTRITNLTTSTFSGFPCFMSRRTHLSLALFAALAVSACSHGVIKGTQVADTEENRTLYGIIEEVRTALEARDAQRIIAHVSPKYFEDMGTADMTDDFGYDDLVNRVLPQSLAATQEMQVAVEVQDIVVEDDRAYALVRYASRARIALQGGSTWDSHKELNRIDFAVEDGAWKIVSGL
jgi:hypothetical protein